ncbi:MAG: hypothetical protein JST18_01565 [Bacteroidetes bacterium]|nr:hypothetical protein [Bacteroidota bacterium]
MQHQRFVAHISWDSEAGMFFGIIPGVSFAYAYARTEDELKTELKDVLRWTIENLGQKELALLRFHEKIQLPD